MGNLSMSKNGDSPKTFKAGSVIFAQGKTSKYLYLVKSGEVRLIKAKGQSLTVIQLCGEREILNEVATLTMQPNDLSAIAATDVELVLVDQKDVLSVIKQSPSWIPEIFGTLCERLKRTQEMIDEHNLAADKNPLLIISKDDEKRYLQALADFNAKN